MKFGIFDLKKYSKMCGRTLSMCNFVLSSQIMQIRETRKKLLESKHEEENNKKERTPTKLLVLETRARILVIKTQKITTSSSSL